MPSPQPIRDKLLTLAVSCPAISQEEFAELCSALHTISATAFHGFPADGLLLWGAKYNRDDQGQYYLMLDFLRPTDTDRNGLWLFDHTTGTTVPVTGSALPRFDFHKLLPPGSTVTPIPIDDFDPPHVVEAPPHA